MPARIAKLDPARVERLVTAIKAGNYLKTACKFANLDPSTLRKWMRRGKRDGTGPYADVVTAVQEALVFAEVQAVAQIRKAADDNWTAAAWYLERKYPDRWGRKDRLTHEGGSDARPVRVWFGGRYLPSGDRQDAPRLLPPAPVPVPTPPAVAKPDDP